MEVEAAWFSTFDGEAWQDVKLVRQIELQGDPLGQLGVQPERQSGDMADASAPELANPDLNRTESVRQEGAESAAGEDRVLGENAVVQTEIVRKATAEIVEEACEKAHVGVPARQESADLPTGLPVDPQSMIAVLPIHDGGAQWQVAERSVRIACGQAHHSRRMAECRHRWCAWY